MESHKGEAPDHFDSLKYDEADALEDEVLFPEEADEESTDNLFRPDTSAMAKFEQGKFGDIRRFMYDLDPDEDVSDYSDDPGEEDSDFDGDNDSKVSSEHSSSEIPSDEDDDEFFFEKEEEADKWALEQRHKSVEAQKAWDEFSQKFQDHLSLVPGARRQNFIFDHLNDPSKPLDLSSIPEHLRKSDEDVMALMRLSLMKERNYEDTSDANMRAEFERYINREKSKGKSISLLMCGVLRV
jgi:hypothetical protein